MSWRVPGGWSEARFRQLNTESKQLVDTIKMIAYRAETAMANGLREHLTRPDEARRLLCALYTTEADLLPAPQAGTLTVRLHHSANAVTDQAIEKLCAELTATETQAPLARNRGSPIPHRMAATRSRKIADPADTAAIRASTSRSSRPIRTRAPVQDAVA